MIVITTPYVFVSLYIMLGDADGSIRGTAVVPTEQWFRKIAKFKQYLAKRGTEHVTRTHDQFGEYHVTANAWTIQPCTKDEAETLIKFCGKSSREFVGPTDFVS